MNSNILGAFGSRLFDKICYDVKFYNFDSGSYGYFYEKNLNIIGKDGPQKQLYNEIKFFLLQLE